MKKVVPKYTQRGKLRQRAGRPTKINSVLTQKLAKALTLGMYVDQACDLVQIHYQTVADWLHRGEEMTIRIKALREQGKREEATELSNHPIILFARAIKNAQAQCIRNSLQVVKRRPVNWQAAAWLMERKFPDRFGLRQRHEVTGAGGGPVQVRSSGDLSKLSLQELRQLKTLVRKAMQLEPK